MESSSRSNHEVFVDVRALEEGEAPVAHVYAPLAPPLNPADAGNLDVWAVRAIPRQADASASSSTELQVAEVDAADLDADAPLAVHVARDEEPTSNPPLSPLVREHRESFDEPGTLEDATRLWQAAMEGHASSSTAAAAAMTSPLAIFTPSSPSRPPAPLIASPTLATPPTLATTFIPPPPPPPPRPVNLSAHPAPPLHPPLAHAVPTPAMMPLDVSSSAMAASSMAPTQDLDRLATLLSGAVGAAAMCAGMTSTGMEPIDMSCLGVDQDSAACSSSADASFAAVAADTDIGLQFSCPICLEVCEEAVETPCCHNLFCQRCLLSEEHRITRCPICKSGLEVSDVRANVPVRRIVADLPCHCRFDGCGTKLRRRDRPRHEAQCDFMPVRCRYSTECPPLLRSQLEQHEAETCVHRPVLCPMGCGASIPFGSVDAHLGRDCPCWLCKCEYCESPVCRADLDEHVQVHCQLAPVVCGLREADTEARCEYRCERRLLEKHREDCAFRPCTCQHEGCSHITTARLLQSHEESCSWRMIQCPHCAADMRMGSLHQHLEDVCPECEVPCPFSVHGCRDVVPRRLLDMHLQQATSQHLGFVCETLRMRDLEVETLRTEVESLRAEVVNMRTDFNQRLANLAASRPKAPPKAPPLPPPPSPLGRQLAGGVVSYAQPVPSSLAETFPGGVQWSREPPGQAIPESGSQVLRTWRARRLANPFPFARGPDPLADGQAIIDWSAPPPPPPPPPPPAPLLRSPTASQRSGMSLRSPTRVPSPPFLQQSNVAGSLSTVTSDLSQVNSQGLTPAQWNAATADLLLAQADAGPDSNVPTEHAPLMPGLEVPVDGSEGNDYLGEGRRPHHTRRTWQSGDASSGATLPPPPQPRPVSIRMPPPPAPGPPLPWERPSETPSEPRSVFDQAGDALWNPEGSPPLVVGDYSVLMNVD